MLGRRKGPDLDGADDEVDEVGEAVDHDVAVAQVQVGGTAFEVDAAIALLASGGVDVVRSTAGIVDVELGPGARIGNHVLVFRQDDAEEVEAVLRDSNLL